jgi:hypothetical protein
MIRLHPLPEGHHHCPFDDARLDALDWYIPGMRNLADLRCPKCGGEFYGDLLAGQALYTPLLLDKHTGNVYDPHNVKWLADWLRNSYANRSNEPLGFVEEEFRPVRNPLLLNCLDTLYGHCLLKLLNAQYYLDQRPDLDLVVLVPRCLRWMVPDGVAAIWTVDLPLRRGTEWNDWLAAELHRRVEAFTNCWLSVAYSHPHPKYISIERFTRVQPFPVAEWYERLNKPTVTFIWREDRLWTAAKPQARLRRLAKRLRAKVGLSDPSDPYGDQTQQVILLATQLRQAFPALNFAVVGLGKPGSMPAWINDLRTTAIDDKAEKTWCERYARSHVVIGVHGSNMLLPSAHAGATVELMLPERWGNMIQDLLMPDLDSRETLFRYRVVPLSVTVFDLVAIIHSLIRDLWMMIKVGMTQQSVEHDTSRILSLPRERALLVNQRSEALGE